MTIYDKEEDIENSYLEHNNDNNNNNFSSNTINDNALLFLPSKYENIKINLYSLKNSQIESYCQEASNQLDIAINPKRKAEIYYKEKISKINEDTNINNYINHSKMNSSNLNNKLNMTQKTLSLVLNLVLKI